MKMIEYQAVKPTEYQADKLADYKTVRQIEAPNRQQGLKSSV